MPKKAKAETAAPAVETAVEEVKPARKVRAKPGTRAKAKTAAKAPTEEVILQYGGQDWNLSALREKAVSAYVAEGHRLGRVSKITLYVKPEERKLYYVMDDKKTGSVDFD